MTGVIALVEGGGTKFMVGVGDARRRILARTRIATTRPEETLPAAIAWLRAQQPAYAAVGVSSFGPLELDPQSPNWGHVTRTTKPYWGQADIAGPFARAFGCPVMLDTDVNGAALAEARWGAGRRAAGTLYLTVGTGIGGGAVLHGRLVRGLTHPEMGHIRTARHPDDGDFAGVCPFHGDCLEGLASGPAIAARWGAPLSALAPDHPGRAMIAFYLAQAITSFRAVLSPERVILGGGVMKTPGLIARIRAEAELAAGGYFRGDAAAMIVAPELGDDVGLLGALALALDGAGA